MFVLLVLGFIFILKRSLYLGEKIGGIWILRAVDVV